MPQRDGTGPQGQGPRSEFGPGNCRPRNQNRGKQGQGGRGTGRGQGRGKGKGRGNGQVGEQRSDQGRGRQA